MEEDALKAEIVHGDAFDVVRTLGQVDAIVTSPPYPNGRFPVKPAAFPTWIAPLLADLLRVLKPEGSMMLNLGRVFRGGEETDYLEETLRAARAIGWKRLDTIIWAKPNANPRGGPYLTDAHELVYWLAPSVKAYRGFDDVRRPYAEVSIARLRRRWLSHGAVKGEETEAHRRVPHPLGARPSSVVECAVGVDKGSPHPTPMPLDLTEYLVKLACPKGGVVLDPFVGSGTTALAAWKTERLYIGVELDEAVAAYAERRLELAADQLTLGIPE